MFIFRLNDFVIQKIGQYPSLADIANDESKSYRKVLAKSDASELHRAIGLAAHGVGVGSLVYLRRVFENLIRRRFDEFKYIEGWNEADFVSKRMEDKIDFLKDHLPDFLVNNSKVYSILSLGIHELDEETCLNFFEVLKHSIFFILDEDEQKRKELELRNKIGKAIATFSQKALPAPNDSKEKP